MHRVLKNITSVLIILLMLIYTCSFAGAISGVTVNSAPLIIQKAAVDGMVRVYLSSLGSPSSLALTIAGSYSLSDGTTLYNGEIVTVSFNSSTGALTLKRGNATYGMGSTFALRRHSASDSNGIKIAQAKKTGQLVPRRFAVQIDIT